MRILYLTLALPFLALMLPAFAGLAPAIAKQIDKKLLNYSSICAVTVDQAERRERLPRGLLQAISLVESGRGDEARGAKIAWPWTIHAEGKGRFFATKAEAVRAVRVLRGRGVSNIDVGCMQVNLQYHGQSFSSIEEALDPAANTAYAAQFLRQLFADQGSWNKAVAYYHSRTQKLNIPYRKKVYQAWEDTVAPTRRLASARSASNQLPQRRRLKLKTTSQTLSKRAKGGLFAGVRPGSVSHNPLQPTYGGAGGVGLPGNPRSLAQLAGGAQAMLRNGRRTNPLNTVGRKAPRKYTQLGAAPKTYKLATKTFPVLNKKPAPR